MTLLISLYTKDAMEKCTEGGVKGAGGSSVKTESESDAVSVTSTEPKPTLEFTDKRGTLEERRKSLLDHHWAIPSKDRYVEYSSHPSVV